MKMLKKFLVAAVVLIASCAAAFAFDSSNIIEMEKIDNVSRKEFEQLFGDQDAIDEFIDEMITEMRTDEFAVTSMGLIDVDQIDDEDEELLELIADGMIAKKAKKNDVFVTFVLVEVDEVEQFFGGRLVVSHYISSKDVEHVMFSYGAMVR